MQIISLSCDSQSKSFVLCTKVPVICLYKRCVPTRVLIQTYKHTHTHTQSLSFSPSLFLSLSHSLSSSLAPALALPHSGSVAKATIQPLAAYTQTKLPPVDISLSSRIQTKENPSHLYTSISLPYTDTHTHICGFFLSSSHTHPLLSHPLSFTVGVPPSMQKHPFFLSDGGSVNGLVIGVWLLVFGSQGEQWQMAM